MSAVPARQLMSIGDALALLRPEFPDLTISKLRYLETEGLVEPQRTNSGYRKYSHADVQRLRFVLSAQRDEYLPLRVIKDQLDALDRGLEPATAGKSKPPRNLVALESLPTAVDFAPAGVLALSAPELLETVNATAELLEQCQAFGLIPAGLPRFNQEHAAILQSVAALAHYGIEPRHLKAFRTAADREAGLIDQVVTPLKKSRDPEAAGKAEDVARDVAALSVSLHVALVRSLIQ